MWPRVLGSLLFGGGIAAAVAAGAFGSPWVGGLAALLIAGFGVQRGLERRTVERRTAELVRHSGELAALVRSAAAVGASLDERELAAIACRELQAALPEAARVTLDLRVPAASPGRALRAGALVDRYALVGGGTEVECRRVRAAELALAVGDTAKERELLVPLERYGKSVGALRITPSPGAVFGDGDARLAVAMGAQILAALVNARLHALATIDGLTGLGVRRHFDARLDEEIERSNRFGSSFSLLLLDLDDFKRINDRHGHPAGDQALREASRRALAQLRAIDIAGRYGGEEFAVILPRTAVTDAAIVAERIRAAIARGPLHIGSLDIPLTASIGVTIHHRGDDASAMVARADAALYRAKAAGKNRVELAAFPSATVPQRARGVSA